MHCKAQQTYSFTSTAGRKKEAAKTMKSYGILHATELKILDEKSLDLTLWCRKHKGIRSAVLSTGRWVTRLRTLIVSICAFNSLASLVVTEAAITGLDTPHARPRAVLLGTKT